MTASGYAEPVVITGMGWAAPPGLNGEETLDACACGRTAIRQLDGLPGLSGTPPIQGATVPPLDIARRMRYPKAGKFINRSVECALSAAYDAAASSGLDWPSLDSERISLVTASGQTGLEYHTFFNALDMAWEGDRPRDFRFLGRREAHLIDRYFSLRTLANGGLAVLSMELGARGSASNHVHSDTAFSSALSAAQTELQEHRCDVAVAGGYECLLTASNYLGYQEAGLLDRNGGCQPLRPFDRRSAGLALGEGAAFFVLERKADAQLRGAGIAELLGIAAFQHHGDGSDNHWDAGDLQTLIEEAGVSDEPDCVVAHGLGLPEADCREREAWRQVLGDRVPVTAFKGLTGYLGSATEAVELALTILCLQHSLIPAIAGLEEPLVGAIPDFVVGGPRRLSKSCPKALLASRSWTGSLSATQIHVNPYVPAG